MWGSLHYVDTGAGIDLVGDRVTALTVDEESAVVSGTCVKNGVPCAYTVIVHVGEREHGDSTTFRIISTGLDAGGSVGGGSISITGDETPERERRHD